MIRSFVSMAAALAVCCVMAAPAQAGGGGGGSKASQPVQVKNVGPSAFSAAAESGASSQFPTNPAAYKQLNPGNVGSFTVKKGTFTLFGRNLLADGSSVPVLSKQFQTANGTTYVIADPSTGLATKVDRF